MKCLIIFLCSLLLCSFAAETIFAIPVTDGLIGYWPGEGNADDESGNSKHGTLKNGTTFSTGLVGLSFSLDGIDDYVELPLISGLRDFTMSAWFKRANLSTLDNTEFILMTGMGNININEYKEIKLLVFPGRTGVADPGEYAFLFTSDANIIKENTWQHVAITATDSDEIKAYLDGMYLGSLPYRFSGYSATYNNARIGVSTYDNVGNRYHFEGLIDDLRVYDRALSAAEIQELYQMGTNQPPVLSLIGNKTGKEDQLLEFQITATDPDPNDVLTFSADNLPSGATFDSITATFSWTPDFEQAGNYENVEFSVTDNGNPMELDTELITITIGNVNRAPEFTPIGPQTGNEDELLEFMVAATDPDGDNITLSASNIPDGATFNHSTGLFSWTPNYLQEGTYTVIFTATDDGDPVESSEMGVPITVGNTPNPTQLTDDLTDDIENSGLPHNVINSYLANVKKVNKFIEKGKIEPAVDQVFAFMCKVEEDLVQGEIDQATANDYLFRATEIVEDLGVDPTVFEYCIYGLDYS